MSVAGIFRSCRRYTVLGEVPEDFRAAFTKVLNSNAFVVPVGVSKERRTGWCVYSRPLSVNFDASDWLHNQYGLFSLRVEQRRVPARLLRARVDRAVQEWCEEHKRARAPSAVREEIKEAVEADLLRQTLPSLRVLDVCWNTVDGWITLSGTSESLGDVFRKLFHRTFGLRLQESDLESVDNPSEGSICFADVGSDFLTWLLWRAGESRGLEGDEPTSFYIDGAVGMEGLRASTVSPAVLAALSQGRDPESLVLATKRGDRDYLVKLAGTSVRGVRLPVAVRGGDVEEQLFEAAFLYEESSVILVELFRVFREERARASGQSRQALYRWIGQSLEPVAAFLERLRAS